ncbi:hypothetical protein B0H12DRAFT_1228884 [Mycena haematopus]|nr:hypothetical protein B0H12DRAFT_1228884 [Mycena haematopus]
MNNNNGTDPPTSALYQYAVPAAVFIFAAVSMTIYFRTSLRRGPPAAPGFIVALRGDRTAHHHHFDPGMKPPVFDAYLGDADGQRWDCEAQMMPTREWAEMMPLSVANVDATDGAAAAARAAKRASAASPSPPPPPDAHSGAEVDPRPPDDADSGPDSALARRVLVSVIVRMPVPLDSGPVERVAGDSDEDEGDALPYLELGLVEVDVRGREAVT